MIGHRNFPAGVLVLGLASLAGCDEVGPLSAAAKGDLPPPPAPPAWAAPLRGQPLAAAFPVEAACLGFVDRPAERFKAARQVLGWAWHVTAGKAVAQVVTVDAAGRMVGFGEGGIARPDVPAALPEVGSPATGWALVTPTAEKTYAVYGIDPASRSACRIGEVKP